MRLQFGRMSQFETELVSWLRENAPRADGVELGIGDDMAVLSTGGGRYLLASDMLLDGVHFDVSRHDLGRIGRKSVACCLSDCAAMAVRPLGVVVSVAFTREFGLERAQRLFAGMFAMAREFGISVIGGDTTVWDHPVVVDVAMMAAPFSGIEPVRRNGARPGDGIFVTGRLGGSALGRHLDFVPRVHEARLIAESCGREMHAMMDISDGLSLDLWRMCEASGVGALLEEEAVSEVISPEARELSGSDGRSALEHALSDGEDFELLFTTTTPPKNPGLEISRIGTITESGYFMQNRRGRVPLEPKGFVHE
jgi:thiamine-monophosphate kinase